MHRVLICLLAVASVCLLPLPASAQGYGVYEQGACVMARGGTGVASPCSDGSSVFFNPAAIALAERQQFTIGGTFIRPSGQFTNDQTGLVSPLNQRTYPVPSIYYVRPIDAHLAAGLGLFAPYGLTTDWPDTAEGRFLGYKSLVQGVYMQPTVAYRVSDRLAVGGGIDIAYVNVELRQRADLSTVALPGAPAGYTFGSIGVPAGTDFADVQLKGHTWSAGYHVGLHVKMAENVSVGFRYLSGQRVEVSNGVVKSTQIATGLKTPVPLGAIPAGTPIDLLLAPQFAAGAALSEQTAKTSIPLPAQIVFGTAVQITPAVKGLVDYQFTRWSQFDALVVEQQYGPTLTNVESYRDTHGIRFGLEYAATKSTSVRGGFLAHTAAAPDQTVTPNLPEGSRWEFTLGAGTYLGGRLRVDLAYQYLHQGDRAGRSTNGGMAVPTPAVNNGIYRFKAHLFGLSFGF